MKLPGRREYQTQKIGTVDPHVYERAGQAYGEMADAVSKSAGEAQRILSDYQVDKAQVDMSNKMTEWASTTGDQDYFTSAEVRDMGISGVELTDTDGNDRDDIPSYEVLPQAFANQMQKEIASGAQKISAPGARKTWESNARMQADTQQQQINLNATKSVKGFVLQQQVNDLETSIQQANFKIAHAIVTKMAIDPVERKEMHKRIRKGQEEHELGVLVDDYISSETGAGLDYLSPEEQDAWKAENDKQIDHAIAVLRSDELYYQEDQFELDKKERHAWANKLEATKRQKAGMDKAAKDQRTADAWRGFLSKPNPTMADVPTWFSAADQRTAFNIIKNGGNVITDMDYYDEVTSLAATDPGQFLQATIDMSRLDPKDYRQVKQQQINLQKGLTTGDDLASAKSQVDGAAATLGITTGAKGKKQKAKEQKAAAGFQRLANNAFEAKRQELGRDLTYEEREQILDRLTVDATITRERSGVMGFLFGGTEEITYTAKDVTDNIPEQQMVEIQKALRAQGVPVTPATLMRAWERMQD